MVGYILIGDSHDRERRGSVPLIKVRLRNSILPNSHHTYLLHSLDPADTSYPRDTYRQIHSYIIFATLNMNRHHSSTHISVGHIDQGTETTHNWTSVYGPDDYDYSPDDPLIPIDPMYCPTSAQYQPSSSPYRLVSPTYCPPSSVHPSASPMYPSASPGYAPTSRPVSPTFSSVGRLGYNGRFHTRCQGHVVLESSDEYLFCISRALLTQAR
jgi:hypothetical protein